MQINCIPAGILRAHCYVVSGHYRDKNFILVIDPGGDFEKIRKHITSDVTHILLTHAHFDHVGALNDVHRSFPNSKICVGEFEDTTERTIVNSAKVGLGMYFGRIGFPEGCFKLDNPDIRLKDGDDFLGFTVLHTPGHTSGSICLYNESEKVLFSGDTLFATGYGRTDIGGNEYDMVQSLNRLMALNADTVIYPGHDQTTTLGKAKEALCL